MQKFQRYIQREWFRRCTKIGGALHRMDSSCKSSARTTRNPQSTILRRTQLTHSEERSSWILLGVFDFPSTWIPEKIWMFINSVPIYIGEMFLRRLLEVHCTLHRFHWMYHFPQLRADKFLIFFRMNNTESKNKMKQEEEFNKNICSPKKLEPFKLCSF